MSKFKLGAIVGFVVGWAVGSGRAAELWDQLQQYMSGQEASPEAGNQTVASA
jgi:hypothetical protein